MKASIAIGVASSLASVALSQVVGVAPSGKWRCLSNPEVVLDFSQINDDFCDCPDGSDEPGTSACPNGKFYCENKGHVPGYIKSFKVNDGVCDYSECCDGSDEWNTPIDCPSRCEEIHKEYQKALDLEKETYKIGVSKVEKTINAASKLRAKLHEQFTAESAILEFLQKELAAKKATLEQAQARGEINQDSSQAQHKIKESIEEIKSKVSDYFGSFTSSDSNLKSLSEILDALVQTFNENLKDAARTFQSFDAIKNSILDKFNSLDLTGNTDSLKTTFNELSETLKQELLKHNAVNERANDLEKLLNHLINNYNPNFNDPNVKQAVNSFQDFSVNRETFQVPTDETISWLKSKIEQVEQLAESLKKSEAEPKIEEKKTQELKRKEQYEAHYEETNETKDDLQIAVEELEKDKDKTERSVNSIKEDLSRYYGPNDLLRPLKDISLKGHIGEYDYELFFIGDVHQKGNNHNVKIGSFSSIEVNDISRTQHQLILTYENGARCWNGPLRKGIVTIDCGAENELLAVTEPEKCEYHFRVKAPIGCKLVKEVEGNNNEGHDEL
ncbi:unnamed protein product [Wickerhamomyces anomalus]